MFLAGCYNRYRDGDRFVILTVPANASVAAVHDRMPLILEAEELEGLAFGYRGSEKNNREDSGRPERGDGICPDESV